MSWLIPTYAIKLDPVPSYIPSISETFPGGNGNETENTDGKNYLELLEPTNKQKCYDKLAKKTGDQSFCDAGSDVCSYAFISSPEEKKQVVTAIINTRFEALDEQNIRKDESASSSIDSKRS